MVDNVPITAGAGTSIATDDVGGVHFQKVKLDMGGDGVSAPLALGQQTMAASVPVVIASNQTAVPVSIATVPALVASDAFIGHTPPDIVSVSIVPTCAAAAYHAGDVLFDSAEIASVARANGKGVELVSLIARDLEDQTAAALTLFFFNAATSLGTKNAAPDINDTEILTLVGMVVIPAAAWIDVGASKVATMQNIGQLMHTEGATTSLWVAGMTAGAPTQVAAGISLTFQFVRY